MEGLNKNIHKFESQKDPVITRYFACKVFNVLYV